MNSVKIPNELRKMSRFFLENGFEAFLVGGAVRDMLRGKKPVDWDIATNAHPKDVMRIFQHVIPTGIEHGTVTVIFMNHHVEVTTFRLDQGYSDGRHPDSVRYASDITEDLSRRDFTMNAAAASLPEGKLTDPFGAKEDIRNRIIRSVGSAEARFKEDGLRPVRAVRFASQLGFTIDAKTLEAIPLAIETTAKIAVERFRDEFIKILSTEKPSTALRLMEQTGLLALFLPELAACRGVEQGGFHRFDVLDHLFFSCDAAFSNNLVVRLAALFHDCGKKKTQKRDKSISDSTDSKKYTFYRHEEVSALETETIMERLKFSNRIKKETVHLVRQHMFHYEENWSDAAVRRFLVRVEAENAASPVLENLFALRLADMSGMNGQAANPACLIPFVKRIEVVFKRNAALTLKSLAVNGTDLISAGVPGGKQIGYILNELLETVIEDPAMNDKEKLLFLAKNIAGISSRT